MEEWDLNESGVYEEEGETCKWMGLAFKKRGRDMLNGWHLEGNKEQMEEEGGGEYEGRVRMRVRVRVRMGGELHEGG